MSELESLIGQATTRVQPGKQKTNVALEAKKKEKTKFLKGFKEEVEKLLFD